MNMEYKHTLVIPSKERSIRVDIGVIDGNKKLISLSLEQRQRVYLARGYFSKEFEEKNYDLDVFDKDGASIHIGAVHEDGRLLGSVRVIHTDPLPIENFFSFTKPTEVADISPERKCEMSRLVVERSEKDDHIPRNILMLFMAYIAQQVAKDHGCEVVYAYIKRRLVDKLSLLKAPFKEIGEFVCEYPQRGSMAPYFYGQPEDPVIPMYTTVEEGEEFLGSILENQRLFSKNTTSSEFTLKKTMYTSFLKHLGIVR